MLKNKYQVTEVLVVLTVLFLYLIVKTIVKKLKRQRARSRVRGFRIPEDSESVSRAEAIGKSGERKVAHLLENLTHEDYQVYNDLLIRKGNYTTQIDHIVISRYGVFIVETKNIHGKVYGSGSAEYWKQYLPDIGYRRHGTTQEHQLRNPVWQNAGHINALRRHVFGNNVPVYGIVAFSDDTDLFVTAVQTVMNMSEIVPYIKTFQDEVLSSDEIDFYRQRLFDLVSTSDIDREAHIANVSRNQERWDAALAEGKCPRCGGGLILREGKYGQFYGCSNYSKCKYVLRK